MDLFDQAQGDKSLSGTPLAERMRPRTLEEFQGQEEIVGPGQALRLAIEEDNISSMLFWGPPGSGKTTLARIIAGATQSEFVKFSAVTAGVPELRKIIAEARDRRKFNNARTILFVDEIHRFNKAQQDAFLPHVEDGTITLIGATTENPSFEVISPLLSRTRVYVLKQLEPEHLVKIVMRAASDKERGLGGEDLTVDQDAAEAMANIADGDARIALNLLELSAFLAAEAAEGSGARQITAETVARAAQEKTILYDKTGEEHYNLISALHKSLRDSDPDGSLYWLGRMLESGEDPLYIVRRLIRFASEDVGNADPQALGLTVAAMQACHFVGMPECEHQERADPVDERAWLRERLQVRPQLRGAHRRPGASSREAQRPQVLPSVQPRLRSPCSRTPREMAQRPGRPRRGITPPLPPQVQSWRSLSFGVIEGGLSRPSGAGPGKPGSRTVKEIKCLYLFAE